MKTKEQKEIERQADVISIQQALIKQLEKEIANALISQGYEVKELEEKR